MQDRSLSIKTTDVIFRNAILKCSKTELLEISHAKSKNNKVSNGTGVRNGESRNGLFIVYYVDAHFR